MGDSSSEESDDEDDGNDSRDGSASIAETNLHAAVSSVLVVMPSSHSRDAVLRLRLRRR